MADWCVCFVVIIIIIIIVYAIDHFTTLFCRVFN